MTSSESSKPRGLGLILVIVGVVVVCVFLFYSFGGAANPKYDEIISVWQKGLVLDEASEYTFKGGPNKIVLLIDNSHSDSDNNWVTKYDSHSWNNLLKENWRPTNVTEVALIAILKEGAGAIETVHYYGGPDITRYCRTLEVNLVEAKTGRLVDSTYLYGPEPREAGTTEARGTTSLYGGPVEFSSLEEYLKEFVFPSPLPKQIVWKCKLDTKSEFSPVIANGRIYVGTRYSPSHNFYCLDATSGIIIWKYQTGGYIFASPVVADGKVFVGSSGVLYCLDGSSGKLIWTYQTGGAIYTSPAFAGSRVYVASDGHPVCCLDAASGTLMWNYTTYSADYFSLAADDGRVYVSVENDGIYCIDAHSGNRIWKNQAVGTSYLSPVVANGRIYMCLNGNVCCLEGSSGTIVWKYPTGGAIYSSPVVADGKVYVAASSAEHIICIDAMSGSKDWWNNNSEPTIDKTLVAANGKAYMSAKDECVYCFRGWGHENQWKYPTGCPIESSPAVANGKIYISSSDSSVCCIDPSLISD